MRISDWSSDVCSSDLQIAILDVGVAGQERQAQAAFVAQANGDGLQAGAVDLDRNAVVGIGHQQRLAGVRRDIDDRSEEHTSELQSLMRISYAVFCLKKKKKDKLTNTQTDKRRIN